MLALGYVCSVHILNRLCICLTRTLSVFMQQSVDPQVGLQNFNVLACSIARSLA